MHGGPRFVQADVCVSVAGVCVGSLAGGATLYIGVGEDRRILRCGLSRGWGGSCEGCHAGLLLLTILVPRCVCHCVGRCAFN